MYFLNKNYSKAIPLFTDLLAKGKIKTLKDSVNVLYILKNFYLNIRQLNKTVEIHKILMGLQKQDPKINIWLLMPRLSTIYYEMLLHKECLSEQCREYEDVKNNGSTLINFLNNRGLYWGNLEIRIVPFFILQKPKKSFIKSFLIN